MLFELSTYPVQKRLQSSVVEVFVKSDIGLRRAGKPISNGKVAQIDSEVVISVEQSVEHWCVVSSNLTLSTGLDEVTRDGAIKCLNSNHVL